VNPELHGLLLRPMAGGVGPPLAELAVTVVEQARLSVLVTGLETIRALDQRDRRSLTFHRTNRPSPFETLVEVLIREELSLHVEHSTA
jgi:hypothetical protein